MLSIEKVVLEVSGREAGGVSLSVRGKDLLTSGIRCALSDKKTGQYLSGGGWGQNIVWHMPTKVSDGGDSLRLELAGELAPHLKKEREYLVQLSFEVADEILTRSAAAAWRGDPIADKVAPSIARRLALGAFPALALLLALAVGAGVLIGPPYDVRGLASWKHSKSSPPAAAPAPAAQPESIDDLRAAAEKGDRDAVFRLASYYDPLQPDENAQLGKSPTMAYRWYRRAAELNHGDAAGRLRNLRDWVQQRVDDGDAEMAPLLRLLLKR